MPPFQHDVGCTPPAGPVPFPGSVSELAGIRQSSALVSEQVYAAVLRGLDDPALFPPIDLSAAESLGSLPKVKTAPAVRAMCALLDDIGLTPQLGYNPSSGRISFTFPLPKPIKGVTDPRQAVVWCMLGLLPWQRQVEKLAAEHWKEGGASQGGHTDMLANRCLSAFAKQTKVCVLDRKMDCARMMTLRVELGKSKRGQGGGPFVFGPSYLELSGYSEADAAFRDEGIQEGRSALVLSMVEDFWRRVEGVPYLPCPEVREHVGQHVSDYCRSAIKDQAANFRPQPSKNLFLHGGAGAGKSSFVHAFADALQGMIRKASDPERRVNIVKVSLNAVTPQYLRSVLCVRGLSDFSIERMVEQTLCKGHTVMLHIEEVPEDQALQAELYDIIKFMLASLKRRYPENFGNVVMIFTSNYLPHEKIREESLVLHVRPPPRESQEHCCKKILAALIKERTGADEVSVSTGLVPQLTTDMRPLRIWWTSMAFHISKHAAQAGKPQRLHVSLSPSGGGADHPDNAQPSPMTETHVEMRIEDRDESGAGYKLVAFDLVSDDGFLHYSRDERGGLLPRPNTVVDMCVGGYLKPGVVLLSGRDEQRKQKEEDIIRVLRVSLREDADKEKVYGKASQIRGGLFKLIDDFNNLNNESSEGGGGVCVIVCEVNEAGQYMLRELLDSGEVSQTHRLAIRKDGVMFVVSVDESAEVQEMMLSRSHYTESF